MFIEFNQVMADKPAILVAKDSIATIQIDEYNDKYSALILNDGRKIIVDMAFRDLWVWKDL